MGLLEKYRNFQQGRQEKRVAKCLAVIKNGKAIKDERWHAIHFFRELEDMETALNALLARFDYSIEHGILDTREKEACMEGIVRWGPEALPHVRHKLTETTRIAWPIKALKKVAQDDEDLVVDTIKSALNFEDIAFDQAQVDKNYDILCYLRDYKIPGFAEKVSHFLKDHDERVRFACVELLVEQDDDVVASLLERFLADDSAENTRIRRAVVDAFVARGWEVANKEAFAAASSLEGITLNKNGRLEAR